MVELIFYGLRKLIVIDIRSRFSLYFFVIEYIEAFTFLSEYRICLFPFLLLNLFCCFLFISITKSLLSTKLLEIYLITADFFFCNKEHIALKSVNQIDPIQIACIPYLSKFANAKFLLL